MIKIGITEAGDAGLDFQWLNKLQTMNIIITKHLTKKNTKLINSLLENKDKIILHVTCTGYGHTQMEPNVPTPEEVHEGVLHIIKQGFPVNQIVLRTDPIIPTEKGLKTVESIWKMFADIGIKRIRYSVIDMYPHVKQRFIDTFGQIPFDSFTAPEAMINNTCNLVLKYKDIYSFEACAEKLPEPTGCISKKDFDILHIPFENSTGGFQRHGCLCCAGKTELLNNKKRCPSGCIYCYWKD